MTRVNSGIPVKSLTDEHLLAEHREIKRLPYYVRRIMSGELKLPQIPSSFCLGKGHIKFFLDKGMFTYSRYTEILTECKKRGFQVTDYSENWTGLSDRFMKDYIPGTMDKILLIERITERIQNSRLREFHYCSVPISKIQAIQIINQHI